MSENKNCYYCLGSNGEHQQGQYSHPNLLEGEDE